MKEENFTFKEQTEMITVTTKTQFYGENLPGLCSNHSIILRYSTIENLPSLRSNHSIILRYSTINWFCLRLDSLTVPERFIVVLCVPFTYTYYWAYSNIARIRHNVLTLQYDVLHSTVQYSTVQYSTVPRLPGTGKGKFMVQVLGTVQ